MTGEAPRSDERASPLAWCGEFARRLLGAILCRASVYREVAGRGGAPWQAAVVVVLASGVATLQDYGLGWFPMFANGAVHVLQWPAWAAIAYLVGRRRGSAAAREGLEGSSGEGLRRGAGADWYRVLGVIGFARAPGIFVALSPVIGGIQFAVQVWMLAAGVIGVREALGIGTVRAVFAALLGMVPYWIVIALYLH